MMRRPCPGAGRCGTRQRAGWAALRRIAPGAPLTYAEFAAALASGAVEVVDLTNPLSADTPTLSLPEPFVNLHDFELQPVAAFDDRAPLWAHNDFRMGEHVGTHVDAPRHWISGRGGDSVADLPPERAALCWQLQWRLWFEWKLT